MIQTDPDSSRVQPHAREGDNSGGQLRSFVERIERLHEERKALGDDIRDLLNEAASAGFDKKAIKAVIAYRAKDASERAEHDALVGLYLAALGHAP